MFTLSSLMSLLSFLLLQAHPFSPLDAARTARAASQPSSHAPSTPASTIEACERGPVSHDRLRRFEDHTSTYGRQPTPTALTIGVPHEDASTALSFGWKTDESTLASQVELRVEGSETTQVIDGFSFRYAALDRTGGRRMHEVQVCGLPPSTRIHYRVGGAEAWSPWHSVRTLVPPGSEERHTIIIAGDSRSSMNVFGRIANAIVEHKPDAVFFTGDLVGDGRNQSLWDRWFDAGEAMFRSTVFIPILGNHEYDAVNYFGQFMLPGDERNFSIDIGKVTWSVFDDDGSPTRVETLVRPRLRELLARTEAQARWMVLHHRPLYSASGRGSNRIRRQHLLEMLEQAAPDAIFTAHNHNYERSCKIYEERCVEDDEAGTIYITTAGAGANLIPSGKRWFTAKSESTFHFVVLHIEGTKIEAEAHALDGRVIDRFLFPPVFERTHRVTADAPPP